ncbi:uncharacterized protein LOC111693027, partial [Anoplophora glabripennis]|uniref:uncharacterized protein LOC111693027 n=1 Tax=Anoplophora glabripennis TaxID=217634 RepID=UPI000C777177
MINEERDILVDISDDDLPKLLEMYDKHKDWAPTAYSTILTGIEWKRKSKEKYTTFMSPHSCWREDGTFFVLVTCHCFDIFIFSLDDTGKNIYEGILKTRRFNPGEFKDRDSWFYMVHNKFYPIVSKAIKDKGWTSTADIHYDMYSIPREQALKFDT